MIDLDYGSITYELYGDMVYLYFFDSLMFRVHKDKIDEVIRNLQEIKENIDKEN